MLHMFHLRLDPSDVHTQSVEYRMHTVSVKYVIWDITFLSVSFLCVSFKCLCFFLLWRFIIYVRFSPVVNISSSVKQGERCNVCVRCVCVCCVIELFLFVLIPFTSVQCVCLYDFGMSCLFVCLCAMCLCMCSKYAMVSSEASLRTPSKQSHSTSIHTSKADRELMQWSRTGRLLKCNHTRSDRPCCSLDAEFNSALIWLGRLATDPSFAASNSLTL